jgi:hypothetical protein
MDKDSDLSNILLRKMRLKDSQFVKEPDAGKLACPVLETIAGGDSGDEFNQPEFGLSKTPEAMQLKGFTKTPSLSLWQ